MSEKCPKCGAAVSANLTANFRSMMPKGTVVNVVKFSCGRKSDCIDASGDTYACLRLQLAAMTEAAERSRADNAAMLLLLREVHNEPVCLPGERPGQIILDRLAAANARADKAEAACATMADQVRRWNESVESVIGRQPETGIAISEIGQPLLDELARLRATSPLTLSRLQAEQAPWVLHNFGKRPSYWPLLGAVEELGELAHAHLKAEQGIRTTEDHAANKIDAVADVVIYLADYCTAEGIDLQAAVEKTWEEVKLRDWKKSPANAARVGEGPAEA